MPVLRYLLGLPLVLTLACTGEFVTSQGLGSGGGGSGADGGAAGGGAAFFRDNILPMMSSPRPKGACAVCHQGVNPADGPDFLGANAGTNYTTLINSSRLIGATPEASVFYTRGLHAGDAFNAEELARVAMWIQMEQ